MVDGVWDEQQSIHVIGGSFGSFLDAKVSDAIAAGSAGGGVSWSRANGQTNLSAFTSEDITFPPVPTIDVDGSPLDTTALTLDVVVEITGGTDVVVIPDAEITKTTTTIQFTVPANVNVLGPVKRWSSRRLDNDVLVAGGLYTVEYAPEAD